jgi:hypothetical protein
MSTRWASTYALHEGHVGRLPCAAVFGPAPSTPRGVRAGTCARGARRTRRVQAFVRGVGNRSTAAWFSPPCSVPFALPEARSTSTLQTRRVGTVKTLAVLGGIPCMLGTMLSAAMKAFVVFATISLCLSSQNIGCSGSELVVCKNPPSKEAACIECLNANCTDVVQRIQSDCSSLLSCTQSCECDGDGGCLRLCNLMTCDAGDLGTCPACNSVCAGVGIGL